MENHVVTLRPVPASSRLTLTPISVIKGILLVASSMHHHIAKCAPYLDGTEHSELSVKSLYNANRSRRKGASAVELVQQGRHLTSIRLC